ncbi:hypothetical protein KY386_01660 [Candidatus Parcubacteria bacterium]|nr:hypothetical protein [Candidatus Parcubacteria bacterium]
MQTYHLCIAVSRQTARRGQELRAQLWNALRLKGLKRVSVAESSPNGNVVKADVRFNLAAKSERTARQQALTLLGEANETIGRPYCLPFRGQVQIHQVAGER